MNLIFYKRLIVFFFFFKIYLSILFIIPMFFWVTYDVEKNGVAVKEGRHLIHASSIFMIFEICVDDNTI